MNHGSKDVSLQSVVVLFSGQLGLHPGLMAGFLGRRFLFMKNKAVPKVA